MNGCSSWVMPSLLALALASGPVGCGDDAGDDFGAEDASFDGSVDAGGTAGRGGGGGRGGGDAGPSMSQCVAQSVPVTMGKVDAECVSCACEFGPSAAIACDATCWSLFVCYARACADVDPMDMNAVAGCALTNCEPWVDGLDAMNAVQQIVARRCESDCAQMLPPDAGSLDAGD